VDLRWLVVSRPRSRNPINSERFSGVSGGVFEVIGSRWFREGGGMPPMILAESPHERSVADVVRRSRPWPSAPTMRSAGDPHVVEVDLA
jgi:hypothetical protein